MGSQLHRGQSSCLRLPKASSSQPASQFAVFSQARPTATSHRLRRVISSAFFFNPSSNGRSNSGTGNNRTRESIANRLSELRSRPEEEANQRPERSSSDEARTAVEISPSGTVGNEVGRSPEAAERIGPWPSQEAAADCKEAAIVSLPRASSGGPITPRSFRYMTSDPKPEIKLLHRFKPGQPDSDNDFWRSFVDKCRLAWGVFFPPAPRRLRTLTTVSNPSAPSASGTQVAKWAGSLGRMLTSGPAGGGAGGEATEVNGLSAKQVVLSRLQMVLIADRCGVSSEHLLEMKEQTLTALAEYMGKDLQENVAQLEVQVSALRPNGERITMTIGFADMLADEQMRDPLQYHYEHEDDDDYFLPSEDIRKVAEIAEAPTPGLKAVCITATPVASVGSHSSDVA